MSFCGLKKGISPENLHRVVYVIITKRSFESFMSLKTGFKDWRSQYLVVVEVPVNHVRGGRSLDYF